MNRKQQLIQALATARRAKAAKASAKKRIAAPVKPTPAKPVETEVITHPKRVLAKNCAVDAMIMGWDKSVQKHAYENSISEADMRQILDDALEYEDKADPAGRIEELQDWAHERRGSSSLAASRRR